MKVSKNAVNRFIRWMNERHNIYIKRFNNKESYPWTDDKILQTYKFTNVYRELDRGTIWCREKIREPYANDTELFFNIAIYRRYNWQDTQAELGYINNYDVDKYLPMMLARQQRGDKVFTGAYMTCGTIRRPDGSVPHSKVEQIFGIAFPKLWDVRRELEPHPDDTLESAFNRCMDSGIPGYGKFLWYEVISDLRWTRYLCNASDILTWANIGPGARRGIARILGYDNVSSPEAKKVTSKVSDCVYIMKYLLNAASSADTILQPLEMREIEHSLCEFDKYERIRLGQGKMRAKFNYDSKA